MRLDFFIPVMKFELVIDYLVDAIGDSVKGMGVEDEKVNKRKEAEICEAFERYVCGLEGDEGCDFFKVAEGDVLFIYNGQYYEKVDMVKLTFIVKKVMERVNIGIVYQKNSQDKIAKECFNGLIADERCRFEPNRRYIVFNNGVLDTKDGKMYEHNIRFKTDIVLHIDYKKGQTSALWDKLIMETIPDEGMRNAFQQFCGGFLADRSEFKIEYMCLMVGSGRNGKSVVCEAITGLFGDELVSSYSPEDLFKSTQSEYRLADINGKLANYADDVSNRDFSGGDFKRFISGAKFQGRHIYGRPFTVTKIPLMLCCVNEIPPTSDDSQGHFRRILPILCPNQIADENVDVKLPQKLATEESKMAIFNWILEGYRKLVVCDGKIDISDSIKAIKEDIKEDSNSARRWIREMGYIKVVSIGPNDSRWKSVKEIMAEYMTYCKDFSESPKTSKSVSRLLNELGFEKKKMKDTTYYCLGVRELDQEKGVELKTENDEEDLPF